MTSTALASLYGGKVSRRRALAGNVGVRQEAREQTVFTPPWFVDCLRASMEAQGLAYALDPCTTPENPTGALYHVAEGQGGGGLTAPWHRAPGAFYANPPYADLEAWLRKAREEHELGARGYLLGPTWFGSLVEGLDVANIRPLRFVGHKSGFPAPLCVVCYGLPVPALLEPTKRGPRSMVVSVSRYVAAKAA